MKNHMIRTEAEAQELIKQLERYYGAPVLTLPNSCRAMSSHQAGISMLSSGQNDLPCNTCEVVLQLDLTEDSTSSLSSLWGSYGRFLDANGVPKVETWGAFVSTQYFLGPERRNCLNIE